MHTMIFRNRRLRICFYGMNVQNILNFYTSTHLFSTDIVAGSQRTMGRIEMLFEFMYCIDF